MKELISKKRNEKSFIVAGLILMIAVIMGAFGAHGLEGKITDRAMETYQTGVRYHFYHGLGMLLLTIISEIMDINLNKSIKSFMAGIFLFSLNCYLYAITGIKTFALIVPVGGVSFIVGWFLFSLTLIKKRKQ